MSFVNRTIQGFCSACIQTTSYAIVSVWYPEDRQKYLRILESTMGIGMFFGPAVGSVFY